MNIVFENWLTNTINAFESLLYDCYIQLGLPMFMITSFVGKLNFIFMMFWVSVLKFGMNPVVEP